MNDELKIDQAFYDHLSADDELGVVVRAHIHVEANVNAFVQAIIPYPDRLPRLQYEGRLRLACALGLRHDHFEALKLLGDIRNSFGHRLDAKLTNEKVNELYSKLPEETQEIVLTGYKTAAQKAGHQSPQKFSTLDAKSRFVFIVVILKSFVLVAAHKAETGQLN